MLGMLRKEWKLVLFGFLMTFCSAPGQTFFISLFSGELREELGLSHGDFGRYYSIATLASAVLIFWTGQIIDRVDLRKFSIFIISGLIVGCIAFSFSYHGVTLVFSLLLLRHFGQGLMFITASTSVVRYLKSNQGKANAISSSGYSLAEGVFPKVIVVSIAALGWRHSWLLFAVILGLVFMPIAFLLLRSHAARHEAFLEGIEAENANESDARNEQVQRRRKQWTRKEVLRDSRFYLCAGNLSIMSLLFTGFIFHQVHLVESKGWQLEQWTLYFVLYASVAILMKFAGGYLIDRFSATAMVPLHTIPLLLAMLLLWSSSAAWIAPVFLVLMAITSGLQGTLVAPFLSEQYGNLHLGGIKSSMAVVSVFASALSPVVMGIMIDNNVSMERQALMGAALTVLVMTLAFYALHFKERLTPS